MPPDPRQIFLRRVNPNLQTAQVGQPEQRRVAARVEDFADTGVLLPDDQRSLRVGLAPIPREDRGLDLDTSPALDLVVDLPRLEWIAGRFHLFCNRLGLLLDGGAGFLP